jgi:hypothetical protein
LSSCAPWVGDQVSLTLNTISIALNKSQVFFDTVEFSTVLLILEPIPISAPPLMPMNPFGFSQPPFLMQPDVASTSIPPQTGLTPASFYLIPAAGSYSLVALIPLRARRMGTHRVAYGIWNNAVSRQLDTWASANCF